MSSKLPERPESRPAKFPKQKCARFFPKTHGEKSRENGGNLEMTRLISNFLRNTCRICRGCWRAPASIPALAVMTYNWCVGKALQQTCQITAAMMYVSLFSIVGKGTPKRLIFRLICPIFPPNLPNFSPNCNLVLLSLGDTSSEIRRYLRDRFSISEMGTYVPKGRRHGGAETCHENG